MRSRVPATAGRRQDRRVRVAAGLAVGLLLVLAVPLLAWWAGAPPVVSAAGSGPHRSDVDRFVADRLRAAHLPGMALAATREDEVVTVRGFGRTGAGHPVGPGTQFRIGSLTKAFTATAVLQLAEAGRVNLDTPVRTYLPEFRVADPRGEEITVRHLLNQTSGMADSGFPEQTMAPPANLAQRVASLRTARLASTPGTRFHYFNPNYDVLARLIEVVTGQPYASWLRTTIFEPLDMHSTLVAPTGRIPAGARSLTDGHLLVYGVPVARPELDGYLGGNGSIVSTVQDLAHWLIAQATGQYNGQRLLGPSSMELLRTVPAGIDTTYAMGWVRESAADGSTRLTHNGVLSTYYAEVLLVPGTRTGVVTLFNSYNALAPYHAIVEGVAALLDGQVTPPTGVPFAAIELPLGWLTLLTLVTRAYLLARVGRWATRNHGIPAWRSVPVLLWLLVPSALLVALPDIVAAFSGRVFSRHQLLRSMPGVHGFLAVAALTGLALATLRVVLMTRRRERHQ